MRMTTGEAFAKVLQHHGIEHVFDIIGSAFMPISDLFSRRRHLLVLREPNFSSLPNDGAGRWS